MAAGSPAREHELNQRIARSVASQADLTATDREQPPRGDGVVTLVRGDGSLWRFDAASTAAASPTVLVPDDAPAAGRWHELVPPGGVAGGTSYKAPVLLATDSALPAYTRTGNTIEADANGALPSIDGKSVPLNARLLLTPDGTASDVDNGIWVATDLGSGSTKFVLERADDANEDGEFVGGSIIPVQDGDEYGSELFLLSNAAAIVINTTAITMVQLPSFSDLGSTDTGEGASLIGVEDAAGRFTPDVDIEAVFANLGSRIAKSFADTTAQEAYPPAARADGQIAIVGSDDAGTHAGGSLWLFASASAAGASDYVRVPDAGSGRWLRLIPTLAELASVLNGLGASLIGVEDPEGRYVDTTLEGVSANMGSRIAKAFSTTAEQTAYSATARADRMIAVVDDDDAGPHADGSIWYFDSGSSAGASDYVRVPDAGSGRWLRLIPTLAELASTASGLGAALIGIQDAGSFFTGITSEAALQELGASRVGARAITFSHHEWREVDASGDVGNLAAHGGILASDSTPALQGGTNEDTEILWVAGNQDTIAAHKTLELPAINDGQDITIRAWVSSGSTDLASFDVWTTFNQGTQTLDALTDPAASATRHEATGTIANADIPAGATTLSVQVSPLAHATDPVRLHGIRLEYTPLP